MAQWTKIFMRLVVRDERGATAIEYGLLAALVALTLFAGAQVLGDSLNGLFTRIGDFLNLQGPPA